MKDELLTHKVPKVFWVVNGILCAALAYIITQHFANISIVMVIILALLLGVSIGLLLTAVVEVLHGDPSKDEIDKYWRQFEDNKRKDHKK